MHVANSVCTILKSNNARLSHRLTLRALYTRQFFVVLSLAVQHPRMRNAAYLSRGESVKRACVAARPNEGETRDASVDILANRECRGAAR